MKKLLVTFGDSWTYGSELDKPSEQNWTSTVGKYLLAETLNLGCPASSIGHLAVQLFQYVDQVEKYKEYKKIFMIGLTGTTRHLSYSNTLKEFINITPEANYRTNNIHTSGRPPEIVKELDKLSIEMYKVVECVEYNKYILKQTMMLFQNYCEINSIDTIFFSYFDYLPMNDFKINYYPESLTKTLTGNEYTLPDIRENQYFSGKLFHPNELGHIKIAELLHEFYTKVYPGN